MMPPSRQRVARWHPIAAQQFFWELARWLKVRSNDSQTRDSDLLTSAEIKILFFHSSSLDGVSYDDLREGQKVTFTEARGQKGPCAENVQVA